MQQNLWGNAVSGLNRAQMKRQEIYRKIRGSYHGDKHLNREMRDVDT